MRKFWAQPLRRQLVLANLLLCLGPVLGLAIWSSLATLRERREDLRTQANIVASTVASGLSRDLRYVDSIADSLTSEAVIRSLDGAGLTERLEQVIATRPTLIGIVVSTADGRLAHAVAPGAKLRLEAWNPGVVTRVTRVADPASAKTSRPADFIAMMYPIHGNTPDARGTLSLFIETVRTHEALLSLPLPAGFVAIISDENGGLIAQNLEGDVDARAQLYGAPRTVAGERNEVEGSDGVSRLYVQAPAAMGAWRIAVGVPADVAFDRAAALWWRSFAVLAIGLAGCVAGGWYLSRRLGASLSHLDAAAQRLAKGDFAPLPMKPMRSAEFADLQTAFAGMVQQFNETRAALDAQMGEERRVRQELESLQGQVIRQERLAAVGQLVSGVAHEINNPLQAILGFAELLQLQRDVPEAVKADLNLIQKESARACAIIRNLALFARQQPGEAAPVTMADVIRSVAELRQRRLESEDIELRIEDNTRRPVKAVLTELQQVVLNFVVNAEQAVIASGRLPGRITLRTYDRDDRVVMEVEDTGPGIPESNESKLFQPFFTTKPVGQGTGLGLSISYGIIDSLGGTIGYRKAPAGGALFYFELPATTQLPH